MSLNDELELVVELKAKDRNLYRYVKENCNAVVNKLNQISDTFDEYTDHSEKHVFRK